MQKIYLCAEFENKEMKSIWSIFSNELHAMERRDEIKFLDGDCDIRVIPFEVYDTLEEHDLRVAQLVGRIEDIISMRGPGVYLMS